MRGPTAGTLLERAVTRSGAGAGCPLSILASRSQPWRSATFAGARHELEASAPSGTAIEAWLARVGDTELPLRGHLLAEARVDRVERIGAVTRFTLAALTVAAA